MGGVDVLQEIVRQLKAIERILIIGFFFMLILRK